jgi:hypothetical protein
VMRELDDALGLSDLAATALRDTRRGKNTLHLHQPADGARLGDEVLQPARHRRAAHTPSST